MISTQFPILDGLILVVWLCCVSQTVSLNRAGFSDNRPYSEAMNAYKCWTQPLRHQTLIKSYCEAWAVWPPWCFKTTHDKREVDKKYACLILLLGTIIYKLNIRFAFFCLFCRKNVGFKVQVISRLYKESVFRNSIKKRGVWVPKQLAEEDIMWTIN